MCANGHNVCRRCRAQLRRCPVCRSAFLNARNRSLETIATKVRAGCGCTSVECRLLIVVRGHTGTCDQRYYKCPEPDCSWKFPLSSMRYHLLEEHLVDLFTEKQQSLTMVRNFGTTSIWKRAILFSGEIFFHVGKVDGLKLYACVLHVGHADKTKMFKYSTKIKVPTTIVGQEVTHTVQNYTRCLNQIIRSGNCATFSYDFARSCVGNNSALSIAVRLDVQA